MSSFNSALERILKHEGGLVDDPADSGGRTNFGITQNVYDEFRAAKPAPKQLVDYILNDEVVDIYRENYWFPAGCALLDIARRPKLALFHFDFAVNAGVRRAIQTLQLALGVMDDGVIGPVTMKHIRNLDEMGILLVYVRLRLKFYTGLVKKKPVQIKFLPSWVNRTIDCLN
jgi:lysozyme family protein